MLKLWSLTSSFDSFLTEFPTFMWSFLPLCIWLMWIFSCFLFEMFLGIRHTLQYISLCCLSQLLINIYFAVFLCSPYASSSHEALHSTPYPWPDLSTFEAHCIFFMSCHVTFSHVYVQVNLVSERFWTQSAIFSPKLNISHMVHNSEWLPTLNALVLLLTFIFLLRPLRRCHHVHLFLNLPDVPYYSNWTPLIMWHGNPCKILASMILNQWNWNLFSS